MIMLVLSFSSQRCDIDCGACKCCWGGAERRLVVAGPQHSHLHLSLFFLPTKISCQLKTHKNHTYHHLPLPNTATVRCGVTPYTLQTWWGQLKVLETKIFSLIHAIEHIRSYLLVLNEQHDSSWGWRVVTARVCSSLPSLGDEYSRHNTSHTTGCSS